MSADSEILFLWTASAFTVQQYGQSSWLWVSELMHSSARKLWDGAFGFIRACRLADQTMDPAITFFPDRPSASRAEPIYGSLDELGLGSGYNQNLPSFIQYSVSKKNAGARNQPLYSRLWGN